MNVEITLMRLTARQPGLLISNTKVSPILYRRYFFSIDRVSTILFVSSIATSIGDTFIVKVFDTFVDTFADTF